MSGMGKWRRGPLQNSRKPRRAWLLLAVAAITACVFVVLPLSSGAVNFASFELDGNTAGTDDWDALYPDSTIFSQDGSGDADDQLVQGTADVDDFPNWTWKAQAVTPPKSDIQWAYATPAVVNNELVLFFGSDRANDDKAGSVNVGFWFLQGDVGPTSGGAFGPGKHVAGDLFVAAEIDSGGRVANIAVYKWDPSVQKNLALQTSGSYGECTGGVLGSFIACGIANNAAAVTPEWRGTVNAPYFFEGGINVSDLFNGAPPCFSSFLSNTRASFSVDAAGQDIVGGQINTCGTITINKVTTPAQSPNFSFDTNDVAPVADFQLAGGQSKEFTGVKPGSYSVNESTLPADWALDSVTCPTATGAGTSVQINGAQVSIALGYGGDVECTYVNKRKPQIKIVKDFEGTATTVNLNLGTTLKKAVTGDDDTGFFTVDAGTYDVNETFPGNNGDLYTSTKKCVKNGSDPGFSGGTSQSVTVANGDEVVCTFKNVRKTVQITTVKDFVGTPASIAIAAGPQSKSITGDDSVSATVEVGTTQTFSETLSDAQKALYTTTVQCTGDNQAQGAVYSRQIAIGTSGVTCTFVNTRKTGTLQVNKDFVPTDGITHKAVTLKRDATTITTTTTDYTGSAVTVDTGSYGVSETFGSQADADLYTSEVRCYLSGSTPPAYASGLGTDVQVGAGQAWVCDFRNTRKTVNVTVEKDWVGTVTPVELFVGGVKKTVSSEPATHTVAVLAGSNTTVGETTAPASYDAFIRCGQESDAAYTGPKELTNVTAPVTCVVTNKEKPQVKVTKSLSPTNDPGLFDLQIGGVTKKDDATNGGTTGFVYVDPAAALAVGEVAGNGDTDLAKYAASVACDSTKGGSQTTSHSFAVTYGDKVSCTISNTRKQGQVTVQKAWVPVEAKGPITLKIGSFTQAFASGDTQSFAKSYSTGTTVNVGETSVPSGFDAFIDCTGDQAGEAAGSALDVTVGDTPIICTVTNKREPRVKLTKDLVPDTDLGTFDLTAGGTTVDNVGDNGTTGFVTVSPGDVTVSEAAGTNTSLADYTSQIVCPGEPAVPAEQTSFTFGVGYGDEVSCTVTNTRNTGTIEVVKVYGSEAQQAAPSPYASVNLKVDGTTKATAPAQSTTGPVQVDTGSHAASETFVTAAKADLYASVGVCKLGDQVIGTAAGDGRSVTSVPVGKGDQVVCTFTNTRKASSFDVEKTASPTSVDEGLHSVVYTVEVTNTSSADTVTLGSIVDDKFGNLATSGHDGIVSTDCDTLIGGSGIPADGSASCQFTVERTWDAAESPHVNLVTVTGTDEDGRNPGGDHDDDASVTVNDLTPTITVTKVVTGATSLQTPGGSFSYSVTIVNNSLVESVVITDVDDFVDTDGSVNGTGTPGAGITMSGFSCELPFTLTPGGSKVCTFTATVSGPAGTYVDVVVVEGHDNDESESTVREDDDASVTLTPTPPPPPPPPPSNPLIDVQVIKDATAQVTLGSNGTATISYSAVVKNNGPNQANDVQLADPAPTGVAFGTITKQPDFGSCQITPALLTCNLGTMGLGVQTLITWTATVSVTGTITNTATTTGTGGTDTNPGNNVDSAQTLVVAPLAPPTPRPNPKPVVKPAAKPAVQICNTLNVLQKMLKATGQKQVIRATVRAGKKPVAGAVVQIIGPGLRLKVKTNARGVAIATVKPSRAGIIQVSITNKKACNTQRIGVVGIFEPPVTG